jgi:hypothetical protein
MAKGNIGKPEKKRGRGRPATGRDPAVAVRLPKNVLAAVTQWAVDNNATRSDAIRRLLEKALGQEPSVAAPKRRRT